MAISDFTTITNFLASNTPHLADLLKAQPARFKSSLTSGDAINGYGYSLVLSLTVEVLMHTCILCGETQFTPPHFDCRGHRFQWEWRPIADVTATSLPHALTRLDERVGQWQQMIQAQGRAA